MKTNRIFTFRNICYIFFILLFYFIICEVVLRISWEPSDKKLYPYLKNSFLRIIHYPNKEFIGSRVTYNKKWIHKTNPFGFRSSSMKTMKKDDNTYRIFFIGGSTVAQSNFPEEKTTWKIVEEHLNKRSKNIRFECINAGALGTRTQDSVALLAHELLHFDPDMIVVMQAINDLTWGFIKRDYNPVHRHLIYEQSFIDILKNLCKKSYLLIFVKRIFFDRLRDSDHLKSELVKLEEARILWRRTPKKKYTDYPSFEEFKKNIKSLIGIAKTNDIRICFLTQPSLYSENMTEEEKNAIFLYVDINFFGEGKLTPQDAFPDISTLYKGMGLFNKQIKIICRENDVGYIDLANMIPKDLQYFIDQCHYSLEGARLAAEIISNYLWDNRSQFVEGR